MTFSVISFLIGKFHFIEKLHKCSNARSFLIGYSYRLVAIAKNKSTYTSEAQSQLNAISFYCFWDYRISGWWCTGFLSQLITVYLSLATGCSWWLHRYFRLEKTIFTMLHNAKHMVAYISTGADKSTLSIMLYNIKLLVHSISFVDIW